MTVGGVVVAAKEAEAEEDEDEEAELGGREERLSAGVENATEWEAKTEDEPGEEEEEERCMMEAEVVRFAIAVAD